jgi:8-oxo-dGTP pyrophosphatase MutT (NUDIX family)
MSAPISRVDVVATVIYCGDRLLLVYNDGWGAFTLPMTKLRNWQVGLDAAESRWELGHEAALRNVAEGLHAAVDRQPVLLMDFGNLRQSDRSHRINHYAFQVFGFEADRQEVGPGIVARWLTCAEILEPARQPISPTARKLVAALLEAALSRQGRFPPSLNAASSRTAKSSVALIGRRENGETQWLCQWNENWQRYYLVGGRQDDGETAEACLVRELKEKLHFEPPPAADYSHRPRQRLEYVDWSTSTWWMTDYEIDTFDVDPTAEGAKKFVGHAANRWVAAHEIRSERCSDDKLISPTVRLVLRNVGEFAA